MSGFLLLKIVVPENYGLIKDRGFISPLRVNEHYFAWSLHYFTTMRQQRSISLFPGLFLVLHSYYYAGELGLM